jgi:hypothetical protein
MAGLTASIDWSQVVSFFDGLKPYSELLLVLVTFLLVFVTWLLWCSTRKAAQIAQASHHLARRLAQLETEPALVVEVETLPAPRVGDMQSQSNADVSFQRRQPCERFMGLKVTNVGRGPARILGIDYGDKTGTPAKEIGCWLLYPKMFVRFNMERLKGMFNAPDQQQEIDCTIHYTDCGSPDEKHVFRFALKSRPEPGVDLLVVPRAQEDSGVIS